MSVDKYIVYYRVSSKSQGESGLGLDAQRRQVGEFVRSRNAEILDEYTEIESGTHDDRPQLQAAFNAAQLYGVPVLIAKLDRLSRSAAFLMRLQESGVQFTCADMPDCCPLTIGVLALVARQEREAISKRTKAALQEAKARGQALGGVREGQRPVTIEDRQKGIDRRVREANVRAERYRVHIVKAVQDGAMTGSDIARAFNAAGLPSPQGKVGTWQSTQVNRMMRRLGITVRGILKGEHA